MSLLVFFSAGRFSPIQEPWVPGYLVSLALAISSYCLRHVQSVQLPLSLLFITLRQPCFPRKLRLRGC